MIDPFIGYTVEGLRMFGQIALALVVWTLFIGAWAVLIRAGWQVVGFARIIAAQPRAERRQFVAAQVAAMRRRRER